MPEFTDFTDEELFVLSLSEWMRKQFGWGQENKALCTPVWEDDWTLIVKLHAMIETGLNGALLRELEKPALATIVAKLDTSNQATGKVAFAKALGILSDPSAKFIQQLSELRNKCVHDVRNFNFNLIKYLGELKEERRKEILKHVNKMAKTTPSCPQEGLLIGGMSIMSELMVHDLKCQARDAKRDFVYREFERLGGLEESKPKE